MMHALVKKPVIAGVAAVGLLAGCAADGTVNKQTIGAGLGAAAGAAIGTQIGEGGGTVAAVIVGALLGGLIGSEIGRAMDERDRLLAANTTQDALESYPSGRTATWSNPDTGYEGTVTPRPARRTADGICRDFEQTITVDGRTEVATGVACRQPDGTWRIVSS